MKVYNLNIETLKQISNPTTSQKQPNTFQKAKNYPKIDCIKNASCRNAQEMKVDSLYEEIQNRILILLRTKNSPYTAPKALNNPKMGYH